MNAHDLNPALLQALAMARDDGPHEGVHVRAACGFAPTAPYVAEMTRMSPVGPIITRGSGFTREAAVDDARSQFDDRLHELAPADIRETLKDPDKVREALLADGHRVLEIGPGTDIGAVLEKLRADLDRDPDHWSEDWAALGIEDGHEFLAAQVETE